jgi:purine-binding chemotaxis protein CheW
MSPEEAERQVVVFSVLGEPFALPITSVREIVRYTPPGATATASGLIRGMLSLRDRLIPIVDLSPALGGQIEVGAGTRILIIEASAGVLGLIVDSVGGIVRIAPGRISALPAAANRELGEEIAAVDERLIVLLDPERVAVAAGLTAPARRARRRVDPGSRESKAAPSDPRR